MKSWLSSEKKGTIFPNWKRVWSSLFGKWIDTFDEVANIIAIHCSMWQAYLLLMQFCNSLLKLTKCNQFDIHMLKIDRILFSLCWSQYFLCNALRDRMIFLPWRHPHPSDTARVMQMWHGLAKLRQELISGFFSMCVIGVARPSRIIREHLTHRLIPQD